MSDDIREQIERLMKEKNLQGEPVKVSALFTEREWRLIRNCQNYARNDPAGLPGHNLMMLVDKLWGMISKE